MNKYLILSIPIIVIVFILSTPYKHTAMTLFQVLYYHDSSHQDNKLFPSVFMDGNPNLPPIEKNLINFDKTKYDFTKYTVEAIMVLHKNKIVLEEYYNSNTINSHFNLFSATKSIVSLGVGILQDRNLLSINDKIKKYLPFLPLKDQTTIKDILEMSSGYGEPLILSSMFDMGLDYFAYNLTERLIKYKVSYNPGEYYIYKNLNTQILGLLIEKISGQKLNEFIYENIYKYIGKEKAEWSTDRVGNIKAFCCLFITTEDFLRFGKLINDKGKFGDKSIISEDYLNQMFTPNNKIVVKDTGRINDFYGLQAWTTKTQDGHKIKYFSGLKAQFNVIIEDLDLVISYFSNSKNEKDNDKNMANIVEDVRTIISS